MPVAPSSAAELRIPIVQGVDVISAQIKIRRFARDAGFDPRDQWRIAIAVSEAATNILKFGERGEIIVRFVVTGDGDPFLEFVAHDEGQGFTSVEEALRDRFTEGVDLDREPYPYRGRGLGLGLGAIARMMDVLEIGRGEDQGAVVCARKWLRRSPSATRR